MPMSNEDTRGHHYTTNAFGGRVLHGLTATETDELERMWRDESAGHDIDRAQLLELLRKHEVARIQAVSAEVQGRRERNR
jgi:hypothetical protein